MENEDNKDKDYLSHCNNKELDNDELLDIIKNINIIYYYCNNNKKDTKNLVILDGELLKDFLLHIVTKIDLIEKKITSSKDNNLIHLKDLLQQYGYLKSDIIKNDPVLGEKYKHGWQLSRIFDDFIKKFGNELNLTTFKQSAPGQPLVVCKRDNKPGIIEKLRSNKKKEKLQVGKIKDTDSWFISTIKPRFDEITTQTLKRELQKGFPSFGDTKIKNIMMEWKRKDFIKKHPEKPFTFLIIKSSVKGSV